MGSFLARCCGSPALAWFLWLDAIWGNAKCPVLKAPDVDDQIILWLLAESDFLAIQYASDKFKVSHLLSVSFGEKAVAPISPDSSISSDR